jgi:pyruvate dehydrogenase E2 component (dihydrolipoamide acetyltransferase)
MPDIQPIVMPKWGLAMQEGTLAKWSAEEGSSLALGQEIMDIETSKIANVFESPVAGTLRKRVAQDGDVLPVGALLGVVADKGVSDSDIDAYVAAFQEKFASEAKDDTPAPEPVSVDIGGRRIRYLKLGPEEASGATPVLFVHGFGSDHAAWLFNHMAAAEKRDAYAVDLPGHGGSAKEVGDGSASTLAKSVSGLIDHLGLDKVHLVGHSLGAAVAILVAADKPGRVASLALIAPAGLGATINGEFLDGFLREARGKKLRPVIEMLVADPDLVTSDMVEDVLKFKRLDGAEAALTTVREANFKGSDQAVSVGEALGKLSVPIAVIVGAEDRIIPPDGATGLPASVRRSTIAGAGHIPHMEKSSEVNQILDKLWS